MDQIGEFYTGDEENGVDPASAALYFYLTGAISVSLMTMNQFAYLIFGFKLMTIEAQMPHKDRSLEEIYRRVANTILFSRICTIFFACYQTLKLVDVLVLRPRDKSGQSYFFYFWNLCWLLYNLLLIPLWIHFWLMSGRFCSWLGLSRRKRIRCVLATFFLSHIANNVSAGVVENAFTSLNYLNGKESAPWLNTLEMANKFLLSFNLFFFAMLILAILARINRMVIENREE